MTNDFGLDPTDLLNNSDLLEVAKDRRRDKKSGYGPLPSLEQRQPKEIKIAYNQEEEGSVTDRMFREFGYSMPIAQEAAAKNKNLGFLREGNITDPMARQAITEALAISHIIMHAECFNRRDREREEERLEQYWRGVCTGTRARRKSEEPPSGPGIAATHPAAARLETIKATLQALGYAVAAESVEAAIGSIGSQQRDAVRALLASATDAIGEDRMDAVASAAREVLAALRPPAQDDDDDDDEDDEGEGGGEDELLAQDDIAAKVEALIDQWSEANTFMLNATIYEDTHGRAAARHLYDDFEKASTDKAEAEFEAGKLPAAYAHWFRARIRRMEIAAERSYDVAMKLPTFDYGEVRDHIRDGRSIGDIVMDMDPFFQTVYEAVEVSLVSGEPWRELMSSLIAGQQIVPRDQPMMMPWGMPYPYGAQPQPGAEGAPDQRPAIFNLFGKKDQKNGNGKR